MLNRQILDAAAMLIEMVEEFKAAEREERVRARIVREMRYVNEYKEAV